MNLRLVLAALVLANLGYFFWSRVATDGSSEREPQRLTQQIHPEWLEIRRTPAAPLRPDTPAPAPAAAPTTP